MDKNITLNFSFLLKKWFSLLGYNLLPERSVFLPDCLFQTIQVVSKTFAVILYSKFLNSFLAFLLDNYF